MSNDQLKVEGILSKGYGLSPKLIMKDKRLTIEAKAIYAYMASYAGNGQTAFPSMSLMQEDLDITEKRLRKHRDLLVDAGYLEIVRERNEKGHLGKNVYTLKQIIETPDSHFTSVAKTMHGYHQTGKTPSRQNDRTNSNSSFNNNSSLIVTDDNNNSRLSSSEFQKLISMYEDIAPGSINKTISEHIGADLDEYGFELVEKAFEVAALQNKRFYSYISGILRNWKNEGVRSVADLEDKKKSAKRKVDNDPAVYKGVEYNFD